MARPSSCWMVVAALPLLIYPGLVEADRQMALPTILGPEQRRPSRDVLFSIRPSHAEKILNGQTKRWSLRRRFANAVTPGTLASDLQHESDQRLDRVGENQSRSVHGPAHSLENPPKSCLSRQERFRGVFHRPRTRIRYHPRFARALERPVGLTELRKRFGFEPPQSYQYASPRIRGLVENERPQAPH